LTKSDIKPAVKVLARAFQNYTLLQYYFPDELKRQKIATYFLASAVFSGIRYGEIYATSSNLEGIAVWMPSENYPVTSLRLLRSVPLSIIFGFGRYGGFRIRQPGEYMDAAHRRLAPFRHWFLEVIGVDPRFQGKGYAGKLLRSMLARTDKEGLPCYLETLNEQNALLYEHFGFEVVEKSTITGTSLTNWAMLREARSSKQ